MVLDRATRTADITQATQRKKTITPPKKMLGGDEDAWGRCGDMQPVGIENVEEVSEAAKC